MICCCLQSTHAHRRRIAVHRFLHLKLVGFLPFFPSSLWIIRFSAEPYLLSNRSQQIGPRLPLASLHPSTLPQVTTLMPHIEVLLDAKVRLVANTCEKTCDGQNMLSFVGQMEEPPSVDQWRSQVLRAALNGELDDEEDEPEGLVDWFNKGLVRLVADKHVEAPDATPCPSTCQLLPARLLVRCRAFKW